MKLERFDHLVLTVCSIAGTSAFYRDVLGMEVVTFGEGRIALGCGIQKINLHEMGREGRLVAARPTSGSGDLCFVTTRPLPEWTEHLRDPDGNLLEIATELDRPDELAPLRRDRAWVAAPGDSLGVRPDGTTFSRPGRLTIAFEKRDGRWLARHTHCSLSPAPA